MDTKTLAAYDREAAAFADDWHQQPAPVDLHALVQQYFRPGLTADVGCGSGRDTAWLNLNKFPTIGYDPSEGLLAEARRRHPGQRFQQSALPELAGIANGSFANILCETVIMHLDAALIDPSVRKLISILEPGGTLYLSWRVTEDTDRRDDHERLYAAFDNAVVLRALAEAGSTILRDEQLVSASSGKTIHRIIARRTY